MQWDELTEKDRECLLLQHVMGCFILEETAKGWNTPEFGRGTSVPAGFHWPIAFWNTDCECWAMRDIASDPSFFDPLHDLNDAWLLVEKMKESDTEPGWEGHHTKFSTFCSHLEEMLWDTPTGPLFYVLWNLTPEAICKAALKTSGIEIS